MPRIANKSGKAFRHIATFAIVALFLLAALPGAQSATYSSSEYITTYFSEAGNSAPPSATPAQQGVTPVIAAVLQSNVDNAQWLLTCPETSNPTDTLQYFTTATRSFIVGNRCLASSAPLVSTITFQVDVHWAWDSEAQADMPSLIFQNIARGTAYNLAYSGTTSYQDTGSSDIASGYNTESYIFGQVPASTQYGLWSWTGEYADLSGANFNNLNIDRTLNLVLGPYSESCKYCVTTCGKDSCTNTCYTQYYSCSYPYTYHLLANVTELRNVNIPVPAAAQQAPSGGGYLIANNQRFSPFTEDDLGFGCKVAMYFDSGPSFVCGRAWSRVTADGTLFYNGHIYTGLNVYTDANNPGQYWTVYSSGPISYTSGYAGLAQTQNHVGVGALPYMLYNISIPATYSNLNAQEQFLNLSLDIYSAQNFLNPPGHLEDFPFYTDSGFFANYSGPGGYKLAMLPQSLGSVLAPADPTAFLSHSEGFLSTLTSLLSSLPGQASMLGKYYQLEVPSPSFISASPNDYVYVIKKSSSCIINCQTSTYLYKMRFIPSGDYNLSNYPPGSVSIRTDNTDEWNATWRSYWSNSIIQQSQNLYMVSVTTVSDCNAWLGVVGKHCSSGLSIVPKAIASDYAGDVFLLGSSGTGGNGFVMAEIPNSPGSQVRPVQTQLTQPSGFTPGPELAVSPGGDYAYAASTDDGGVVNIYQTPTFTSSGFNYIGNVPLSYSNAIYNLNIAQYMKNGGPFNDLVIRQAFASAAVANDVATNHHPVAIADSKGLLIVLDNWTFSVGGKTSAILMLRAFVNVTQEVPIDGAAVGSLIPVNSAQMVTSQGTGGTPVNGWSPYGWPISATITAPDGSMMTYCAAFCTKTPGMLSTAYPPIGPRIDIATGYYGQDYGSLGTVAAVGANPNDFGLSMDFNDTIYVIAHTGSRLYINNKPPDYTELLVFKLALENYTKLSYGAYSPFECYIDTPTIGTQYPSTPCTVLPQNSQNGEDTPAQILSRLYPPLLGVPSSFYYVESAGSPERYLSLQSILSSVLPFGLGDTSQYQQQANTLSNRGILPYGGKAPTTYNNLAMPSGTSLPTKLPATYINSIITGSLLVPYCTSYRTSQRWTPTSKPYSVPPCGYCGQAPAGYQYTAYPYCATTSVPISSGYLNNTIEGGGTYLESLPSLALYNSNLSDAGSMGLPFVNYNIFTNRLFGEAYVNLTVNPANYGYYQAASSPVVVNAVQNYNYQLIDYVLNGRVAYSTQKAIPSNPPTGIVGANCGSACPQNYYYSSRYFAGRSGISYAGSAQINFVTLTALYAQVTQLDGLVLDLNSNQQMLGYNRLIYTFVDTFNNIIYAPLDTNFAYTTQISLVPSATVNALNPNESTVTVNGIATYTTPTGSQPLSNAYIYLYYNANANYYDTANTVTSNPGSYYWDSLLCAFTPGAQACQLANPLYTDVQEQPTGMLEANAVMFSTAYNAMRQCNPEPASLLAAGNIVANCNIYGSYGLSAVRRNPNDPSGNTYQYCIPDFQNGNGIFTSQLGLANVVETDGSGNFGYKFEVCGTGQERVIASYYGYPPPQPQSITQTSIAASSGAGEFSPAPGGMVTSPQFTYKYAPSSSSAGITIGSYALGFGSVNALAIVLLAAAAIVLARRIRHS